MNDCQRNIEVLQGKRTKGVYIILRESMTL